MEDIPQRGDVSRRGTLPPALDADFPVQPRGLEFVVNGREPGVKCSEFALGEGAG